MMRVLLTWELGLNHGHLARLLPIAERLKAEGHVVLVASRDLHAAAQILGPAGIPFMQAPHLPKGLPLETERASGYADILLSQGWSDRSALWGLVQGWLNLIRLFRPDRMILDYSPTAMFAARIAQIPAVLVGNGFELPPATAPLPAFPGFSWATPQAAAMSEARAIENANAVSRAFRSRHLDALRDLLDASPCLLATVPKLDHYGERKDAQYIGPLFPNRALPKIAWPRGSGPKIFVCVRPDTNRVGEILGALTQFEGVAVCVAQGFRREQLSQYTSPKVTFSPCAIDLSELFDAQLCVTYGAEGTVLTFLNGGVPQLVMPWHVETYLFARRLRDAHLGDAVGADKRPIANVISASIADQRFISGIQEFQGSMQSYSSEASIRAVVDVAVMNQGWAGQREIA